MSIHQDNIVVLTFEEGGTQCGWTLKIRRENNSTALEYGLYWKDKDSPSHLGIVDLKDFEAAMAPLLTKQVSA